MVDDDSVALQSKGGSSRPTATQLRQTPGGLSVAVRTWSGHTFPSVASPAGSALRDPSEVFAPFEDTGGEDFALFATTRSSNAPMAPDSTTSQRGHLRQSWGSGRWDPEPNGGISELEAPSSDWSNGGPPPGFSPTLTPGRAGPMAETSPAPGAGFERNPPLRGNSEGSFGAAFMLRGVGGEGPMEGTTEDLPSLGSGVSLVSDASGAVDSHRRSRRTERDGEDTAFRVTRRSRQQHVEDDEARPVQDLTDLDV